MKRRLQLAAILVTLMLGTPARGQYIYLDVNGDGRNSQTDGALPADQLGPSVTRVDVYLVTDKNRDGNAASCSNSSDPFSLFSYEFTLHAFGSGTVTYGTWTDNLGFGFELVSCGDGTLCSVGSDVWVARGTTTPISPGTYRVGSLIVSVTGTPVLDVVAHSQLIPNAQTAFGSNCLGSNFDDTVRLGADFTDSDGTEAPNTAVSTVWGKIKQLYR